MAELPPAPRYPTPDYAAFGQAIGNLPGDYRDAQQQQGNIDYVALLRKQMQEAQQPSPLWSLPSSPAAPAQPPPAPSPPPAPMPAPPPPPAQGGGAISGTISDGAGPPPTLAALVSGVAPDPTKAAPATAFLAKVLQVDPTAPLTPDQVARAQRIMTNLLKPSVAGPAMGAPTQPSGFAGRVNVPPDPAVAGASAIAAPPRAPAATPSATGGASGPFSLPPAAEAVWGRMVPQESGGKQFNPDGSIVTSPTGAIGIAQIEPGTGPTAAKMAGLPWDPVRFKNDPNYNLALGRAYYAAQVSAFGSPEVAAAAYNAGPRAVLSAQAKATTRGGSYLDYLPAETRDYVAKVTTGGTTQAGGGAPPQGNRPLGPQIPLPQGANGDPQRAILMLRQEAGLRRDRGAPGQAGELDQWADAIAKSTELREVRQGETLIDPVSGEIRLRTPGTNANSVALQRFLEQNPDATPQQIQAFTRAGQAPRSAAGMSIQRFLEENPNATSEQIQEFTAQGAATTAAAKTTAVREQNLDNILKVAQAAIPAALELSDQIDRTNWTPINSIIQNGRIVASDPKMIRFGIANLQLAEGWARGMNPTGVMRESDRDKALDWLSTKVSKEGYRAAVMQVQTQLKRERDAIAKGAPPRDPNAPLPLPDEDRASGTIGGGSSRPTATNPQTGQKMEWDGTAWVVQ